MSGEIPDYGGLLGIAMLLAIEAMTGLNDHTEWSEVVQVGERNLC